MMTRQRLRVCALVVYSDSTTGSKADRRIGGSSPPLLKFDAPIRRRGLKSQAKRTAAGASQRGPFGGHPTNRAASSAPTPQIKKHISTPTRPSEGKGGE